MPAELPYPAVFKSCISRLPHAKPESPVRGWTPARRVKPAAGWLLTLVFLLVLLSGAATALAQTAPLVCSRDNQFINNWYFGYKAGLDFNSASNAALPLVRFDSQMDAPAGSGVMSGDNGSLRFYSNGEAVWGSNHVVMNNGNGLDGNRLTTDGPVAIKKPGSPATVGGPTSYYLFTQDAQGGPKGLSYSEIVIPAGGGQGDVVATTKNTPLARGTAEKMTAVQHRNGCDIWIIVHGFGNGSAGPTDTDNRGDAFLAYQVTPTGVNPPVISPIGARHAGPQGYRGQMTASRDGERLAVARYSETPGDNSSSVELFAFNAATGMVSDRRLIDSGAGRYYGVAFSLSRSRLFATVMNPPRLLQFDLTVANVPGSRQDILLKTSADLGSLQAAPDGKIYVARNNQPALGLISFPDRLGARARYADDTLQLGGRLSGLGLPNFNQSSLLQLGFSFNFTGCQEITFQANSPLPNPDSYTWVFKDKAGTVLGTRAGQQTAFTFPAAAGFYDLTLSISKSCFCREITGSIFLPGRPIPGIIAASQTLCAGAEAAPLTSTSPATGGVGGFAYQWESSPNGTTSWTSIPNATREEFAPGLLTATTYYRRGVSSGLCGPEFTNTVELTVLPTLNPGSIAASQTICAGTEPAALTGPEATGGGGPGSYRYQWEILINGIWENAPGVSNVRTYQPGPLNTTTSYRRRVTSGTCPTAVSNAVEVRVQPAVTPAVTLAAPLVQCPGTPLTFTAGASNAGPAPTFQWFVNNVAVTSGPTFTSSTLVTGDQVRVAVTPSTGLCSTGPATATVAVTRTPTPPPTLAIAVQPNGRVCPGDPLTFSIASVTGAGPAPEYQWQVNGTDVAGARGADFTSTTLRDGQTVTLRLRTTNACGQAAMAVSNGITVRVLRPVVDAGPDKEVLAGTSVLLEGRADGNYPVTWTPSTGLTFPGNDPLRPRAAPDVTTTYTLTGGTGDCASSDQVIVTVRPQIRIPSAFTPNGDGRDDTWQIEFIEQFPENTVNVFNRWGNRVFSATNYGRANEWKGDINGVPVPVGTYYYVVVTKGPLSRSYSGALTVLH
ncbi:gliding motility-associated C-terminal domain-containing protein [Hymenobacter arizonensis]|uniref:Gliding motility-associated C-terminal domain-containing protein n=1 Tax=Hymenobacter arizonensis TaxID=1227077 RepID=A0A1I5SRM9_HYMAR|nr:gliding motility-associated C-terminal domain-containing protein [Hymenobacter arizonensis]SFP73389.1 gliding motility-associated C-terminal domain-containing protein [Hymenobacter arizonensis]